jgi:hypothetical protein
LPDLNVGISNAAGAVVKTGPNSAIAMFAGGKNSQTAPSGTKIVSVYSIVNGYATYMDSESARFTLVDPSESPAMASVQTSPTTGIILCAGQGEFDQNVSAKTSINGWKIDASASPVIQEIDMSSSHLNLDVSMTGATAASIMTGPDSGIILFCGGDQENNRVIPYKIKGTTVSKLPSVNLNLDAPNRVNMAITSIQETPTGGYIILAGGVLKSGNGYQYMNVIRVDGDTISLTPSKYPYREISLDNLDSSCNCLASMKIGDGEHISCYVGMGTDAPNKSTAFHFFGGSISS